MKSRRFELIIFVVNAISMILELVASRILSPYFGNSNIVWTSVIGIILLSSSIGNYYGGKVADKDDVIDSVKFILIISACSIFLIPFCEKWIISSIVFLISDIRIGAILTTLFLFLVPSIFLGLLTPIILKLKLKSIETAGKTAGNLTAIATIGAITGTFLGGFLLIPKFGSVYILFILGIILLILVPIVDFKVSKKQLVALVLICIIAFTSFWFGIHKNNDKSKDILNGVEGIKYSIDTQYGRVLIYNRELRGEKIRILNIDGGFESATFTDENKKNELVFEYTEYYDLMFNSKNEIKEVLLIGGAGYSYPKYFISHYDDKKMDVVEIDGGITEVAKKYFYLDDLIKDYNLNKNKRLNLINEDGRTYLNTNTKKYDAILNDAFSGDTPAKTLTTVENIRNIKKSLNTNGVYLTNIISSIEGEDSKFIRAEMNTLKQVFNYVYVIPCNNKNDLTATQNNMVIATDDINFDVKDKVEIQIDDNEIILTDDYCPVDTLIPKKK